MAHRTVIPAIALLAGCASDHDIHRVDYDDVFYQEGTDQADILFVVDDSISMADEQVLVAEGFDRFIWAVGETDVDFHLGVVTTDMDESNEERGLLVGDPIYLTPDDDYVGGFMSRVRVGTEGSDKERGLQAALHALTDNDALDYNDGFLREDAVLALVFVSDENDCSDDNAIADSEEGEVCYDEDAALVSIATYVRKFAGLKGVDGRVVASAIVGPEARDGCESSWPGLRYMTVADKLDGAVGNICETDYGDILDDIGSRISGLTRVFYLSYPAVEDTLLVLVDDEEIAQDPDAGWSYDDEFYAVRFDGDYVPDFGSTITIGYDIAAD